MTLNLTRSHLKVKLPNVVWPHVGETKQIANLWQLRWAQNVKLNGVLHFSLRPCRKPDLFSAFVPCLYQPYGWPSCGCSCSLSSSYNSKKLDLCETPWQSAPATFFCNLQECLHCPVKQKATRKIAIILWFLFVCSSKHFSNTWDQVSIAAFKM